MRNAVLHQQLEAFAVDASRRLVALVAAGEEIPFELSERSTAGGSPLYCYRPLTERFIRERRALLAELPGHAGAARGLAECDALDVYLSAHGEVRIPADRTGCAALALQAFLAAMFAERSEFGFEPAHFETTYAELERTVYAEHAAASVIAPVLGVGLDSGTTELGLGDGLSLIRGEALAGAPAEAVWSERGQANVLAVLRIEVESGRAGAVPRARVRFRRLLSALRLFESGTYALGSIAWSRTEGGHWRMVPIGASGRIGGAQRLTIIPGRQEEELRAFCRLVGRGGAGAGRGELDWALARFEMGCERSAPLEALTDHLLALRALLEPEGSDSGRLSQRLAVICAQPDQRAALARRISHAIDLERAAITGMAGTRERPPDALVDELSGHLRAILRDALCGHLDADLCRVADELLDEAVGDATALTRP